ncbi:MAG: hypothetical protein ABW168_16580 [Sedimenticola sp.]
MEHKITHAKTAPQKYKLSRGQINIFVVVVIFSLKMSVNFAVSESFTTPRNCTTIGHSVATLGDRCHQM